MKGDKDASPEGAFSPTYSQLVAPAGGSTGKAVNHRESLRSAELGVTWTWVCPEYLDDLV